MMEEDGGDVVAAALRDDCLAAKLLLCLSRPEAAVPAARLTPKTELTWGSKRPRSRTITREGIRAAEREDAMRASPTTPLWWSVDGSGTSGSVCSGGAAAAARPQKRGRDGESCEAKKERAGKKRIRLPPAVKGTKHEPPRDGEAAANALGAYRSSASEKLVAVVVAAAPAADAAGKPAAADLVACPEPLRCRSAAGGVRPVVVGRRGKKKTLAELRAMEESLLQEQAGLRKELESHKALYAALLQENTRLKKAELTEEEGGRPSPILPFDLNCMPEDEGFMSATVLC